jgi:hypothetical protein
MAQKEHIVFNKSFFMKFILLCLLLIVTTVGFCQTSTTNEIKVGDTALLPFLEISLSNSYFSRLNKIGEWGVCWLKFELSKDNQVSSVSVSPGTNPVFSSFLKEVIEKTSGRWTFPTAYGQTGEKVMVVPLWYNLQKGGKSRQVVNNEEEILSFLSSTTDKPQNVILFPKLEYVSPFVFESAGNSDWVKQ